MRYLLASFTILGVVLVLSSARADDPPAVYRACPGELVWNEAQKGCVCPGLLHWDTTTKTCSGTCPVGKMPVPNAPPGTCQPLPHTCPPGNRWSELHNACVVSCPGGKAANKEGTGCVPDPHNCPAGTQWFDARSGCFPFCEPGKQIDYKTATCVEDGSAPAVPPPPPPSASTAPPPPPKPSASATPPPPPPPAPKPSAAPPARAKGPTQCPEGKEWKDAFDACVPICANGEVLDFYGKACHPIKQPRR